MKKLLSIDLESWCLVSFLSIEGSTVTRALNYLTTLGMSQSTARKYLFTLIDRNILELIEFENDKRIKLVVITDNYKPKIESFLQANLKDFLAIYSKNQQDRFHTIYDNYSRINKS